ncbi:MAG: glycosyltransferase family 39 protein [Ilumatobacteraceae bacterium]|nr:glycosyltransferase family 39 protein [Ilumatobacteraceae bacterium]
MRKAMSICLVVLALALLSFVLRSSDDLAGSPLTEDGYYSLSVARSLADGHGLTIDGTQLTNGFQPAFTVVTAVAFIGSGSVETSLRIVLLLHWLVFIATAYVIGLIARDLFGRDTDDGRLAQLLAPVLFLSGLFTIQVGFNGLETGALLLGYALAWRFAQTHDLGDVRHLAVFGVILGLVVLVRIDAVFFVAAAVAAVAWRWTVRRGVLLAAVAAVVSSPWWIYNAVFFGSLVPSSGTSQTDWALSTSRLWEGVRGLAVGAVPWLTSSKIDQDLALLRPVITVVGAVVVVRLVRRRAMHVAERRTWEFAAVLCVTYLALAAWYLTSSHATHFYGRYLAPVVLVVVMGATVVAMTHLRRLIGFGSVLATVVAAGAVLGLFHSNLDPRNPMLDEQVALVEAVVPVGETVAAKQSGTLGFFRSDVVNLDGKVNPEALEARGDMPGYISRIGVRWLCDWDAVVERIVAADDAIWTSVDRRGTFVCWYRQ